MKSELPLDPVTTSGVQDPVETGVDHGVDAYKWYSENPKRKLLPGPESDQIRKSFFFKGQGFF